MLSLFSFAYAIHDYIVMLNIPHDVDAVSLQQLHHNSIKSANALFSSHERIKDRFTTGYIASMNEKTANKLLQDPTVAFIEPDNNVNIAESGFYVEKINSILRTQNHAPWGISRLSSGSRFNDNGVFEYPSAAGENVDIYILDTGIDIEHRSLNAVWGLNLVEGSPDMDEHGHGTHVSGTIAGSGTGIAKKAKLIAVKVLDKSGGGKISKLILGIDFVIRMHAKKEDEMYEKGKRNTTEYHIVTENVRQTMMTNKSIQNILKDIINEEENIEEKSTEESIDEDNEESSCTTIDRIKDDVLDFSDSSTEYGKEMISTFFYPKIAVKSKHGFSDKNLIVPKNKNHQSEFLDKLTNYLKLDFAKPRTVVNMSVGGLKSRALDFAVDYASRIGIHFAVAAGNDHEDACLYSPGSNKSAITVGASTKDDSVAFFSNIGSCVDIFAPGAEIFSTWPNNEFRTASGTSMASPHVAGVMALYLSIKYYDPHELKAKLLKDSLNVVIDEDNRDMLEFWPLRYLFKREKHPLVSIKSLNETVKMKKEL